MHCPVCRRRKARRACPALGQTICSVCCGTKRLVEIQCTPDCVYLASAREHPAAVVRRQQELDAAVVLPTVVHLSERQYQLFLVLQTVILQHKPEGFLRLSDDDVAEAVGAIAATFETSAKGVVYEHTAESRPARALAAELKQFLAEVGKSGGSAFEREATPVLRSIERGAREARLSAEGGGTAYLQLMGRLMQQPGAGAAAPGTAASGTGGSGRDGSGRGTEEPPGPSPLILP